MLMRQKLRPERELLGNKVACMEGVLNRAGLRASTHGTKTSKDEPSLTDFQAFPRPQISWVLVQAGLSCP